MKKTLILPTVLLCVSSIGLVSALVRNRHLETEPTVPETTTLPAETTKSNSNLAPEDAPVKVVPTKKAAITLRFKDFLALFKKQEFPFEMRREDMVKRLTSYHDQSDDTPPSAKEEKEYARQSAAHRHMVELMARYLPESGFGLFQRVPSIPMPIALMETPTHYVLVYGVSAGFSDIYCDYEVAVFSKEGNLISTNIAGDLSPETLKTFVITEDLHLQTESWELRWKEDFWDSESQNNRITQIKSTGTSRVDLLLATNNPDELPVRQKDEILEEEEM
jgi:hypothetical protein